MPGYRTLHWETNREYAYPKRVRLLFLRAEAFSGVTPECPLAKGLRRGWEALKEFSVLFLCITNLLNHSWFSVMRWFG